MCDLANTQVHQNSSCSKSDQTSYYYYDKRTHTCELYTLCAPKSSITLHSSTILARKNQFYTRQGCEDACIHEGRSFSFNMKVCLLAPVEGPCRHYSSRYFYDPEERKCLTFTYGGCFGNKNNFHSAKTCKQSCLGAENRTKLSGREKNSSAICYLSDITGPCKGSIRRFYFDPDSHTCLPFSYGGCGGNENRFVNEEDCLIRCMPWATKAMLNAAKDRDDASRNSNGGQSTSPLIIAEAVLGTVLLLLLGTAIALSYRYTFLNKF